MIDWAIYARLYVRIHEISFWPMPRHGGGAGCHRSLCYAVHTHILCRQQAVRDSSGANQALRAHHLDGEG